MVKKKKFQPKKLKITDAHLSQIEAMMHTGVTLKECAHILGLCPRAFVNYRKDDPRINEAIERGKAKSNANVGKSLYKQAIGGNMNAIRWYEITRTGHRERTEIVTTEKPYVVEIPASQTEEEWEDEYSGKPGT